MELKDAIKRSMQTEKYAMDFYRLAAARMSKSSARSVFELLAREEREHAASFYKIYPGNDIPDFEAFLNSQSGHEASWYASLEKSLESGFTEQKALAFALDKEKALEESLRRLASGINQPEIRAVFEMNAEETHRHYLLIEADYARMMRMVHESEMDTYVRE
ncbi:MAG: ferritin [Desulfuromonadales bacterium GWD2_61_12]|nr:MAG: ferritin [Desulfuromonadales bacterium GWC2_61_20]OGR34674.1 MAG: ferritin [Desulfuromonadales bacterium GWD2_61_12]HAD05026.1 ferritin [Desulfuromonas sp.]HBT83029.1 ferritin [Desulfuromonas sp.]